jgi:hypothetical protein
MKVQSKFRVCGIFCSALTLATCGQSTTKDTAPPSTTGQVASTPTPTTPAPSAEEIPAVPAAGRYMITNQLVSTSCPPSAGNNNTQSNQYFTNYGGNYSLCFIQSDTCPVSVTTGSLSYDHTGTPVTVTDSNGCALTVGYRGSYSTTSRTMTGTVQRIASGAACNGNLGYSCSTTWRSTAFLEAP